MFVLLEAIQYLFALMSPPREKKKEKNARQRLVIGSQKINFYELFKDVTLDDGAPLRVEQAAWEGCRSGFSSLFIPLFLL